MFNDVMPLLEARDKLQIAVDSGYVDEVMAAAELEHLTTRIKSLLPR